MTEPLFQVQGIEKVIAATRQTTRIKTNMDSVPDQVASAVADILLAHLQSTVPISESEDHEHARDLLHSEVTGAKVNFFGPEYLKFVVEGTEGHEIEAVNGEALHFFVGGDEVFAKSVWNPGITANDFRRTAWENANQDVSQAFTNAILTAIKEAEI